MLLTVAEEMGLLILDISISSFLYEWSLCHLKVD